MLAVFGEGGLMILAAPTNSLIALLDQLGLAISRAIIENNGGRLWAVPNDGPGGNLSICSFEVPVTVGL
jgi:hypothetical protein